MRIEPPLRWDMFCRVIDNFGDLGVCWRLSRNLATRGQQVRLWVDAPQALAWMAPDGCAAVDVRHWSEPLDLRGVAPGDVLIEAFGCDPPATYVAMFSEAVHADRSGAATSFRAWINIEYLSAEPFAERCHGLPSPVQHGAGAGLVKHFFFPGFTARTGGVLREADLAARQSAFRRADWLHSHGVALVAGERVVSLFCYEPPSLGALIEQLAAGPMPTRLLVAAGRPSAAVRRLLHEDNQHGALAVTFLPHLSQHDFDHLLWASDLNFVRGEDSLVRALWARRPLVWQAYPQHDGAHAAKLEAWLRWLEAPATLARWHRIWNGSEDADLPVLEPAAWQPCAQAACARLLAQPDLAMQLLRFVAGKS
ncbi:MAG: elongation factor P maturation arginine rhamnosyltransferase EarP [Rhodoferax sp.]|uniref:elongation factor P maturation arginine rhamnosyltransferase EarP n=1 Tax=Rhodoferax sp. TaxID=50421 RepID=UPI003265FDF2